MDLKEFTTEEYKRISNISYSDFCNYLNLKYGKVPYKYGNKKNREKEEVKGLFIHHIGENEVPSLCATEARKTANPKYQQPDMLVYCNWIEHIFLHILIAEEVAGSKDLGLDGPYQWIMPQVKSFFNEGKRNSSLHPYYYERIKNNKELFNILVERFNAISIMTNILFEHNQAVFKEMCACLETKKRCLLVIAPGGGKTTTSIQYALDNLDLKTEKVCVVVPTDQIKSNWENDLLRYNIKGKVFTYAGFSKNEKYKNEDWSEYKLIILDESHHVGYDKTYNVGAKEWYKPFEWLLTNTSCMMLGLTGTEVRSDGIKLSETLFKDCTVYGKTTAEMIREGIIYPFSYISVLYNVEGIMEEIRKKYKLQDDDYTKQLIGRINILKQQQSTTKVLPKYIKAQGIKKPKGIVFVSSNSKKSEKNTIDEAKKIIKAAFPHLKNKIRVLYSDYDYMSNEESGCQDNKKNKEWFEKTDEGFIITINAAGEGWHPKGINCLFMFRKTKSFVVFLQQLGRIITLKQACSINPNAIVFDLVNNITSVSCTGRLVSTKHRAPSEEDKETYKILRALQEKQSEQVIVEYVSEDIVECLNKLINYSKPNFKWDNYPEVDDIVRQYKVKGIDVCIEEINTFVGFNTGINRQDILSRASILGVTDKKTVWEQDEINLYNAMIKSDAFIQGDFKTKNKLIEDLSNKINKTSVQIKYRISAVSKLKIQDDVNKKSDLSEEQINYILAHRDLGRNKVAKEVNTSPYVVSEIWKEYNTQKLVSNLEKLTNEDKNFIAQYSEKMPKEELISHLSVKISVPELCRYLRKNGLKGRGRNITLTEEEKQKHSIATRKHKTHIFTKEEVVDIVNKLLSGVSMSKLITELHLDRNTIKKAIIENGYNYEECLVNSNQNKKKNKIV